MLEQRIITTMDNFRTVSKHADVAVFGAGEYCMRFLNRLEDKEIRSISFIVDNDSSKHGTSLYGIPVKEPDAIKSLIPQRALIVIANENSVSEINKQITDMGDYSVVSACLLIDDTSSQVAEALVLGSDQTKKVMNLLSDDKSRRIYSEVIRRRILYGKCDFSDLIVKGDAEYRVPFTYKKEWPKDEIIIDCGAYNGDTLKMFSETYGFRLKKIYLFECMEESIRELLLTMAYVRNKKYCPEMVLEPYALSDDDGEMVFAKTNKPNGSFLVANRECAPSTLYESEYVNVEVRTLDEIIPKNEKITFIKMDIEGSEYAALHGAERILKTYKPRLAISIYHSGEDYYRIPLYLKTIVPEYKFAVRHHSKNYFDTDLYCWIEE